MGYTTSFAGKLTLSRKLTIREAKAWLVTYDGIFNGTVEYEPDGYLQWLPTESLNGITWDEGEKFYNYIESMEWAIKQFIEPARIIANGVIVWTGEEAGDYGRIEVIDNAVTSTTSETPQYEYEKPLTKEHLVDLIIASVEEVE